MNHIPNYQIDRVAEVPYTDVDYAVVTDRLPLVPISDYLGTVELPAFNIAAAPDLGAPYIVQQYLYSTAYPISLIGLSSTLGDTFVLCVKYRIGDEVFRYKLNNPEDILVFAPLYNGEVIKGNFVLEVWCKIGVAAVNAVAILIQTSKIHKPTNITTPESSYTESQHTDITLAQLQQPLPFDGTQDSLEFGLNSAHETN